MKRGLVAAILLILVLAWATARLGAAQLQSNAHTAFWRGEYRTALSRYRDLERLSPAGLAAKDGELEILLGVMDTSSKVGEKVGMTFPEAEGRAGALAAELVASAPLRSDTWANVADFYAAVKLENQRHRVYTMQSISPRPEENLEPEDVLQIRAMEMATRVDPNGFYYWDRTGDLAWNLGLRPLALSAYSEAVILRPEPSQHLFLSALELDPRLEEMTLAAMEKALKPPRSAEPETLNRNLGYFLMSHGRFGEARLAFERAAEAAPWGRYLSLQAFAASHSGHEDEAIRLYRKALTRDRPGSGDRIRDHLSLGELLEKHGKHKEAAREIRAALGVNPRDPKALLLLARILEETGNGDEAEDLYMRAAASSPEPITALVNLVDYYRRMNLPDKALVPARKLVELQPDEAIYRKLLKQLNAEIDGRRGR